MKHPYLLLVYCVIAQSSMYSGQSLSVAGSENWTYIEIDNSRQKWGDWDKPEWLRYFGLDWGDLNGDCIQDIVSGRYAYMNPGGNMSGAWERIDFGLNTDAYLIVDVDGDAFADVIACSLPSVYWLEAKNTAATKWSAREIASIKATGHVNGQGYDVADIIPGGSPEILITGGEGLYMIEIPDDPSNQKWRSRLVFEASDEGFGIGDIDSDGDLDIAAAEKMDREPRKLFWWENQNGNSLEGKKHYLQVSEHPIDRIEIADFNDDSNPDIVYSEERYPGKEPDANLVLLNAPDNPATGKWSEEILITQYSMNNLDAADIDEDGDIDIVTNEHMGDAHLLQVFRNDGNGAFHCVNIGSGKEMHLGAKLVDLDGDGDLDILGHAWNNYQFLHLWRNNRIQ